MAVWTLLFSTILLPLFAIAILWLRPRRPLFPWVATLAMAAALTGFSVLAAPWGWFGLPMRFVLALLFCIAVVASVRRTVVDGESTESPLRTIVKLLITMLFGGVAVGAIAAHAIPPGAVNLQFPLRNGTFLVAHGGSHAAANIHAQDPAQRYGVDLVELNAALMRARGIHPSDLTSYKIFGAPVYAPCAGTVKSVVDGLPDNAPGAFDDKHPLGNEVVLRCGDLDVTLAQLRKGSVAVRPGMAVAAGQPIANVGSSGNTTEPHLHVHAQRGGVAVAATFDGKWLVRNAVVRK